MTNGLNEFEKAILGGLNARRAGDAARRDSAIKQAGEIIKRIPGQIAAQLHCGRNEVTVMVCREGADYNYPSWWHKLAASPSPDWFRLKARTVYDSCLTGPCQVCLEPHTGWGGSRFISIVLRWSDDEFERVLSSVV